MTFSKIETLTLAMYVVKSTTSLLLSAAINDDTLLPNLQ
jgi:hypothetical protein